MELEEMQSEIEDLKQRNTLNRELGELRRDRWRINNAGLIRSWESAKKDGGELLHSFGNFLLKINRKEERNMEEKQMEEPIYEEEYIEVKERDTVNGTDMSMAPAMLVI